MGDWGFFCSLQFMFVQFLCLMCGVLLLQSVD